MLACTRVKTQQISQHTSAQRAPLLFALRIASVWPSSERTLASIPRRICLTLRMELVPEREGNCNHGYQSR